MTNGLVLHLTNRRDSDKRRKAQNRHEIRMIKKGSKLIYRGVPYKQGEIN